MCSRPECDNPSHSLTNKRAEIKQADLECKRRERGRVLCHTSSFHPILSFLHNFSVGRDAKLFSSDAFLSLTITHMPSRVRTINQNRIKPIFFRLT